MTLQEVYDQIESNKKEKKKLKDAVLSELQSNTDYCNLKEEKKLIAEKITSYENACLASSLKEAERIDDLTIELKHDQELLSDIALNMYLAGERVEVTNSKGVAQVPNFSVKLKKKN